MKFRSAIDTWFYVVALALPGVIFLVVIMNSGITDTKEMIVICLAAVIAFGLPVWLLVSTCYVVEAGTLTIRSGPLRWSIPVSEIKSVKPSRSIWSSPALSLNRLKIQYGRGKSILVSPADIKGFQNAIGHGQPPGR